MVEMMVQVRETKRQALLHVADFSRYGPLAQVFIMDALPKQGVEIPPYQRGDTNLTILTKLLDADELGVLSAVMRQAKAVIDAGSAANVTEFESHPLIHGAAWFGVAQEVFSAVRNAWQPVRMVCPKCGTDDSCGRDGTAAWDVAAQQYVLGCDYDQGWYSACDGDVELKHERITTAQWAEAQAVADATDPHKAMVALRALAERAADIEASRIAANVGPDDADYKAMFGLIAQAVEVARIDLPAATRVLARHTA